MLAVTVPGIFGSDVSHWQSVWQRQDEGLSRFRPRSWDTPDRDDWRAAITSALGTAGPDALLIAHSLGCLATVDALLSGAPGCRGVFLVSPPDADGERFPTAASTFRDIRLEPLPVPSLVVAAEDDPFSSWPRTLEFSAAIDAPIVSVGRGGHLNSASGLGAWPEGQRLLSAFSAGAARRGRGGAAAAHPTW